MNNTRNIYDIQNFNKIVNRRCTDSLKWHVGENELPMWVADMDFQTAPAITEALKKRADHGIFGYSIVPKEWHCAYQNWWSTRHGFNIEEEWLLFCTGVIPAISTAVRRLTNPGDNVLILSPVYNHFYISIEDNGRRALESRLLYEDNTYAIDWKDFEEKLKDPQTTLLIFSNPHNPTGEIWDKETLARVGELTAKYHVIVISDEIHCDLTEPGYAYVPFASVSDACRDNSISCIAPTKAFNIAGLHSAAIVVPNRELRAKMAKGLKIYDAGMPGTFAVDAAVAAFTEGGPWLDALRQYIKGNKDFVCEYIKENIPQVKVVRGKATYLMWLDFSSITDDTTKFCSFLRKETGLFLNEGELYRGNGKQFARLNVAAPKALVEEGLKRLKAGVENYIL